jgi:hypothetical protein
MPAEELKTARERIERFHRLGGVDLSRLREAEDPLRAEIEIGLANYKKTVFTYRCEICGRVERLDQEMSPACTGPSWTEDHPLEPMVLV